MIDLLRKRRSIRKFQKKSIDQKIQKLLEEALLRAPSSRDLRPWKFIFVDDRSLLEKLSHCKEHGADFLSGSALGIVVCGDETVSDVWIEDCAIASILVQMAALELGVGSCWIQVRNRMADSQETSENHIKKVLEINDALRVECIIALGYPAEHKKPVPAHRLDSGKVGHARRRDAAPLPKTDAQAAGNIFRSREINLALKERRRGKS